ncbi:hypothetical protein DFR79_13243 [Halanaerobium saccharolyticum]|uniref:Uncharacterized protein n=1 Tax=Halanaerobium saccharolyticum TaxID=43595 RepID=A0A4R6LE56_9FIRM|nr:hypothetical protein [Halanaerobium saccharolyticum]TDO77711.1 hypothetical protein DFR79_13243 [Halanaerobium saccharolyticum]
MVQTKMNGDNEGAEEGLKKIGAALERHGETIKFKTTKGPPPPPLEVKENFEKKYNKLGMAVAQLLNYMDMEEGSLVVRGYDIDLLETLIKNDFGYLVHGKYSNIGDDK